ncbi:MAG: 2-oxoacid:ferredoxin oxidoreductase subunit gamma [Candidatus Omnitrophica bacterium]|nr:2-oxoacid:ferredoxin oxidoreductase subunit gamma [Candidatus Omnitrophota bacterium]
MGDDNFYFSMKNINESIICAGFGGQGIMTLGKVLANAAMVAGYHVTWMPSYGAEVRGGTAHAMIKISSEPIASPMVREVDTAIIMNDPSLQKFGPKVKEGGLLIVNTSIVSAHPEKAGRDLVLAPLTDEALEIGNIKTANMIAVGIYIAIKGVLKENTVDKVMEKMAAGREKILPVNRKAVERGMEIGQRQKAKGKG